MNKKNIFLVFAVLMLALVPFISAKNFYVRNVSDTSQSYFFVNGTDGNVGIGTSSPNTKLEISGGKIRLSNDHALEWGDSSSAIVGSGTADTLRLYTAGSNRLHIDSSGNVGIGTSTPQNVFNVIGDGNFTGLIYGNGSQLTGITGGRWNVSGTNFYPESLAYNVGIGTDSPTSLLDLTGDNPMLTMFDNTGGGTYWRIKNGVAAAGKLTFCDADTPRVTFVNDGNVGIGTSSPSVELEVNGSVKITGSNINLDNGLSDGASILFSSQGNTNYEIDNSGGSLRFFQPGTTRMTIDSVGNVGIGTSSPSTNFEVEDNSATTSIQMIKADQSGDGDAGIVFAITGVKAWTAGIDNSDSDKFKIGGDNVIGTDTKLTIESGGNVGIGTSSPSAKFHINESEDTVIQAWSNEDGRSMTLTTPNASDIHSPWIYQTGNSFKWMVDAIEALFIQGDGNVGIGTSSPLSELHIEASATPQLTMIDTGTATGGMFVNGSGLHMVTAGGSNNFIVKTGATYNGDWETTGTERFRIDSTGNVGIGTSSPGAQLEISGNFDEKLRLVDTDATGNPYISFYQGATRRSFIQHYDANDNLKLVSEYGQLSLWTGTGGTEVQRMTILSGGNVGIGTSSPSSKFHIHESGSGYSYLRFTNADTGTGDTNGTLFGIGAGENAVIWNYNNRPMVIGTNSIERMRVDEDGNVGIGTDSPDAKLDIAQDMSNYTTVFTLPHLKLKTVDVVDDTGFVGITYDASTSANYGWSSGALRSNGGQSSFVWKYHIASAEGVERMRIDSVGNVGIGTTSPSAKLDVEVSSGGAATIGSSGNTATGNYAVAMGYNTNASGVYSTAMGMGTSASGTASVAMGYQTSASGSDSTTMGYDTAANGMHSVAMGVYTTASGYISTAIGREIEAGNDYVVAIGLADMNGVNCSQANSMCIMGGNVGIGTSSPSAKLEVAGQVSITGASRIRATRNTTQAIANGVFTKVQYNIEDFDNLGEYDSITNYRFTVTEAGYYDIRASILLTNTEWLNGEYAHFALYKNGAILAWLDRYEQSSTDNPYVNMHGSTILQLTAGDYIEIYCKQTTGISVNLYASSGYNYFSVHRLS